MSNWFYINFIILIFVIWKVSSGPLVSYTILGGLGMMFILYNWTRQAMFATLRSNISRQRKIKYAMMAKKALPFHKWTGSIALVIIVLHLTFVLQYFPFQLNNPKIMSGLFALLALCGVVLFGWLRYLRTTVVRRYVHWTFAYLVILFAILHLLF